MSVISRCGLVLVGALLCGACGDGSSSSGATTRQALVVGDAHGPVMQSLQESYRVVRGRGDEDPARFDLIVFDGTSTSPDALRANAGVGNFLRAGKALVLLNHTEAHREATSGVVWAHARGASPGVAFILARHADGRPHEVVQIEYPVLTAATPPSAAQHAAAATQWLQLIDDRLLDAAAASGIEPADTGAGQTVLALDVVTPANAQVQSVLGFGEGVDGLFCSDADCSSGQSDVANSDEATTVSYTLETRLYALLVQESEGNFQHRIIARQYLNVSPQVLENQIALYQFTAAAGMVPLHSTLGFTDSVSLVIQPDVAVSLGIVENLPEAANNVTELTTSESHTESVGVSATAGIQSKSAVGTVSASWSDAWTWSKSSTISIADWESASDVVGNQATYTFTAASGTPNTTAEIDKWGDRFATDGYCGDRNDLSLTSFNGLQTSAMTVQNETVWATAPNALLPPQPLTVTSRAVPIQGEVFDYAAPGCPFAFRWAFRNPVLIEQQITLDFGGPGLQPPAQAPWTLAFDLPVSNRHGDWTARGTVTLDVPQSTDTTLGVSWIVEPVSTMLTLPASQACPGNMSSFEPAPSVVTDASTTLTIPAGQTTATLQPVFEPLGTPYNVQVVTFQPDGNLQAAWCITVPGQAP